MSLIEHLDNYLELITYGFTNPMPDSNEGPWKITAKDVINGKINYDTARKTTIDSFENDLTPKSKPKINDILLTKDGTLGRLAIVDQENICVNQSVAVLRPNKKIIPQFLYYLLSSPSYQKTMLNDSDGSVLKHIYITRVKKMDVQIPDLTHQKKIIQILELIDNKIDVLIKLNKNLEEQIETIYNSFFVYYDDFSKEELEECEIGLIPKDWKLMSLGEVTTKIKEKVGSDDYKVFSAVNTGNLILSEEYFDKQVYSKNIEKYIVVKQKEFAYNPARINIGSIGRNDFNYDGCVSPVYVAFKVEEGYENFMNMYIKSNRFNQWVVTLSSGSVRQTLNYADFSIIKIAYPPKDLVNKFNKVYDNYYEVINYNNSVISNLENIRDTLLPKLMSGEIDVSKINCDLE